MTNTPDNRDPSSAPIRYADIVRTIAGDDTETRKSLDKIRRVANNILTTNPSVQTRQRLLGGMEAEFMVPTPLFGGRTVFEAVSEAVATEIADQDAASPPRTRETTHGTEYPSSPQTVTEQGSTSATPATSNEKPPRTTRRRQQKIARILAEIGNGALTKHGISAATGIEYTSVHRIVNLLVSEGRLTLGELIPRTTHKAGGGHERLIRLSEPQSTEAHDSGHVVPEVVVVSDSEPATDDVVDEGSDQIVGNLVNRNQIRKRTGLSHTLIDGFIVRGLPVYKPERRPKQYDEETVFDRVRMYRELPVIDPVTNTYTDVDSEEWALVVPAARLLRTATTTIRTLSDLVESRYVKGTRGEVWDALKISHLRIALEDFRAREKQRKSRATKSMNNRRRTKALWGSFITLEELYIDYPEINPHLIDKMIAAAGKSETTPLEVVTIGTHKTFKPEHAFAVLDAYLARKVEKGSERLEIDGVRYVSARQLAAELAARGITIREQRLRYQFGRKRIPYIDAYETTHTVKLFREDLAESLALELAS